MGYKEQLVSLVPLEHQGLLETLVPMPQQFHLLKGVTPVQLEQLVPRVRPDRQVRLDRTVLLAPTVYKDRLDSRVSLVTLALQDNLVLLVGQAQAVLPAQLVSLGQEETQDKEEIQGHRVLQVSGTE